MTSQHRFTAAFPRRVFGNVDRSGVGRTSDRAGAALEVSCMFLKSSPTSGTESNLCKAAMARSGSPICAARLGRGFRSEPGTVYRRLSRSGFTTIACSTRANAAALSPRPILISARSPMRRELSGCSLRKGFQFAASLSPTFLGGGMIAGNLLRPT